MTQPTPLRARLSWALFDWANSAFGAVIGTFVFATYFSEAIAADSETGTAQWGYALTASGLTVALLSPLLGAIADQGGRRKPWLLGFTALAVAGTAALWTATPTADAVLRTLVLFAFGGIYAAGTFGMDLAEVIRFGITLNVTAGIGAFALSWVDDWIGPKRTILLAILGLIGFGTAALLVQGATAFWIVGGCLGVFVGPAQAASRSLMARLAPEELRTEMFGLYALSGKATAYVGPFVLGVVTAWAGSQRVGMATILVFFVVGGALLLWVREPPPQGDRP